KVITYPRTDSRALPEDYIPTVNETLGALAGELTPHARKVLDQGWVKPNKRIFNNAQISDHFAIIPTTVPAKMLNELEQKLYDMVTRRFLAVFYPSAEFLETTRITRVEGEPFKSMGKVLVNPGWLAVYGRDIQTDDTPMLAPVRPNEQVDTTDVKVEACQTKPPPRFTEATLLSAMEGAGKLIEDEELREAMAAKGLGTPATRASIIEGLLYEKYLLRQGKELVPTAKAFSLMALLRGLDIPELTSPELTGEWEFKLKQMEHGELSRPTFMREIAAVARDIVKKAKSLEHDTIPGDFGELKVPCPKCGSVIKETYKKFQCSSEKCDFALWKIAAGRQFEPAEIEELITKRVVGPLQGFRSKMGKPFNALIKMSDDFKPAFDFGQDQTDADGTAKEMDFTGQEPLGKCPKCGSRVFEGPMNYLCEKSTGANRTCDFRTGKIILQRTIDRAQVVKLLETRKTDLLEKFISKKGRPFKAYLVVDKDNKVGFEFEPRQAKDGVARQRKPKEPEPKVDFTGQESIGKCPMCGGPVFESPTQYLCEKAQSDKRPCKFRSGKNILGQVVERDQMKKLLATGKTDLLKEFVSKKGRTFAAHLIVGEKKKIEFEFPDNES
ncbi:MAG TPA: DNA topoisomerase, partial [Candidatus Eisenbacteria bacterium]|nr:DNA topoisomerase [Candidatus Eisenbacteria bacterium]